MRDYSTHRHIHMHIHIRARTHAHKWSHTKYVQRPFYKLILKSKSYCTALPVLRTPRAAELPVLNPPC